MNALRNLSLVAILGCGVCFLNACTVLKNPGLQVEVTSLTPSREGQPAKASRAFLSQHGAEQSGFRLLEAADEALLWRLALADEARKSIDIQYFIWKDDETGVLLFDRLLKAADRGVRVRLLVDELNFKPKGRDIATLCRHPNFEIKIFNPGWVRSSTVGTLVEWGTNFRELNRRMHNKIFLVDGQVAILGGRNIGNEYFGLSSKYNFHDLDTLVVGDVVPDLAEAFDDYWNSEIAYPGRLMDAGRKIADLEELRDEIDEQVAEVISEPLLAESPYPTKPQDWSKEFQRLSTEWIPGKAVFIQDVPEHEEAHEPRLVEMIEYLSAPSHEELLMVSAYFLPSSDLLKTMEELRSDGVRVRLLTGGMTGTNHVPVSAHYKKYRRKMLRHGIELSELHHLPSEDVRALAEVPVGRGKFVTLHSKAIVGDRQRCFIGSLNLDPRAIEINTENGLLIESEALAKELTKRFEKLMEPANAWEVSRGENGLTTWESDFGTRTIQPARSFTQRISAFLFRLLPIESQL